MRLSKYLVILIFLTKSSRPGTNYGEASDLFAFYRNKGKILNISKISIMTMKLLLPTYLRLLRIGLANNF